MPFSINFPERARRDDPNGHMTVQRMLDFLVEQLQQELSGFASGNATVPEAATTRAVTHDDLPASHAVVASPTTDPGGRWWLSNITSTGFQINLQTAAPIGGVGFSWIAKGV